MNFNIKPSPPDYRDYIYHNDSKNSLKEFVDLRQCNIGIDLKDFLWSENKVCLRDGLKILKKEKKISCYKKLISTYYVTEVLNNNKPVVFGMEIYESFMDLNERISTVSFPGRKEKSLGGHAMCMVGYDLSKRLFLAKNIFKPNWGSEGCCWIPFDYIRQEGYDIWTFDINHRSGDSNVLPQTSPLPILPQKILV
jgi:C1A family cysteine protease